MSLPRSLAVNRVAFLTREAIRSAGFLGTATAYHLASGGGVWRMGLALDCGAALALLWQHALDAASPGRRVELLALLARARRDGLLEREAADHAARLAPHVGQLMAWARLLLDGIAQGMAGHRLGPVLAGSVAKLALRLDMPALERGHAA